MENHMRVNSQIPPPSKCLLCNSDEGLFPAGFQQLYAQKGLPPVPLHWWECRKCKGWFVSPTPGPEVIERNWGTVAYLNPDQEAMISQGKDDMERRILNEMSKERKPGRLLDVGCNFGNFMVKARDLGWVPIGLDPSHHATSVAQKKGFSVVCGWGVSEGNFEHEAFDAITVIDAFCFAWNPNVTLKNFFDLLKPGGILCMRVTNKRFIQGLVRLFSQEGRTRDHRISRLLQGQFHSISPPQFKKILESVGFTHVHISPHAIIMPWSQLDWRTKVSYLIGDILYFLSLKKLNFSPGVFVFAKK